MNINGKQASNFPRFEGDAPHAMLPDMESRDFFGQGGASGWMQRRLETAARALLAVPLEAGPDGMLALTVEHARRMRIVLAGRLPADALDVLEQEFPQAAARLAVESATERRALLAAQIELFSLGDKLQ